VCHTLASIFSFRDYSVAYQRLTSLHHQGVFLRTLSFIQEGSKDTLSNNIVNFRKRQKLSEVIHNIKQWQSKPHNFHALPSVINLLDKSLHASDLLYSSYQMDAGELFWRLSASREPGEQENEKLRRVFRENGYI
jgi:son of sevenless-like protein